MFSTHAGEFCNFFLSPYFDKKMFGSCQSSLDPYLDLRLGIILEKSKADNIST